MKEEIKEETLFDSIKKAYIQDALDAGFTHEQSEFLYEKMKSASLGLGLFL